MKRLMMRLPTWLLWVLILGLMPGLAVWAQQTARIYLVQLDTKQFPLYIIDIRLTDDTGRPVVALRENEIEVYEDNKPLNFQLEKLESGMDIFLVFDAGAGIRYGSPPRYEQMRRIANELLSHLLPDDRVGIIIVYPSGPELAQALTLEHDLVRNFLAKWNPPQTKSLSPGLEGLRLAFDQLQVEQSGRPKAIVFFTRGVQRYLHKPEVDENQLATLAHQLQIPVYVYNFHDTGQQIGYQKIVDLSRGQVFHVARQTVEVSPLLQDLRLWRTIFRIQARSQTAEPRRTLRIQLAQRPEVAVAQEITLVPPPAPPKINFVVNNGNEQVIFSLDENGNYVSPDVPITVEVTWPDGYERLLQEVALYINGQIFGAPKTNPPLDEPIIFIWRPNPELSSPVRIEVRAVDELGLRSEVYKDIPLIFEGSNGAPVQPQDIMCRNLPRLPYVGQPLHQVVCQTLGLTLGNVLTILAVGALAVVTWRRREQVVELARQTADGLTQVVSKVAQTISFGGRRKPKARLHILEGRGDDDTLPEYIDIFGETKLGRDAQYVDIVLNRPAISRLHCEIHEDLTLGQWTIEDKESSNGTFLNGERLKPLQPYPLKDGDIIDIAPLYRGGIRLRFELLEVTEEVPDVTIGETELMGEEQKTISLSGPEFVSSPSSDMEDLTYTADDLSGWDNTEKYPNAYPPSEDNFDDLTLPPTGSQDVSSIDPSQYEF